MTHLTEDLRATEPEDALSPALREKLLAEPTPLRSSATLPQREGEEVNASNAPEILRPPASGGPLQSKEVGSKKRRVPIWGFAALALVAWFVCFPLFRKYSQQAQMVNLTADRVRMHGERTARMAGSTASYAPSRSQAAPPLPQPKLRPMPPDNNGPVSAMRAVPMSINPPPPPPPSRAVHALIAPRAVGSETSSAGQAAPGVVASADTLTLNGDPDSLRQVHKEAGIGLRVADPDAAGDKINDMVKETGGYVAANNLTTDTDGHKSGELIVKVPAAQFETFLAAVASLGTVVSKNITGEDITEKTSDAHEAQGVEASDLAQAEARLKSLGKHATWEDKEDTQDERVKLAETRARLKLLKRMAALGTITVDLSETSKGAAAASPVTGGFTGTLQATTHDALQSLVGSAAALLALVIWLLAYAPIWVPLLFLGRYALKEYKKREAVSNP